MALWIPTFPLKKKKQYSANTTGKVCSLLASLCPSLLTSHQTNSKVNRYPRIDRYTPFLLAQKSIPVTDNFMSVIKTLAKLLTTCHVMLEMRKDTTPVRTPSGSLTQKEKEFFSSLATAIELLEQFSNESSMCESREQHLF